MFYLIGLGLCDESDITLRGLNAIRGASRVYLEAYTSILMVPKERLESFYQKTLILADRETVESNADEILRGADKEDVALLVVGDPFGCVSVPIYMKYLTAELIAVRRPIQISFYAPDTLTSQPRSSITHPFSPQSVQAAFSSTTLARLSLSYSSLPLGVHLHFIIEYQKMPNSVYTPSYCSTLKSKNRARKTWREEERSTNLRDTCLFPPRWNR